MIWRLRRWWRQRRPVTHADLVDEILSCRTVGGSAWTHEWDKRLIDRFNATGVTVGALYAAGNRVFEEFVAADTRPGPQGILGGIRSGVAMVPPRVVFMPLRRPTP